MTTLPAPLDHTVTCRGGERAFTVITRRNPPDGFRTNAVARCRQAREGHNAGH